MRERFVTERSGTVGTAHLSRNGRVVDFREVRADRYPFTGRRTPSVKIEMEDDYGDCYLFTFRPTSLTWRSDGKEWRRWECVHPYGVPVVLFELGWEWLPDREAESRRTDWANSLQKKIEANKVAVDALLTMTSAELLTRLRPTHRELGRLRRKGYRPSVMIDIFYDRAPCLRAARWEQLDTLRARLITT